MTTTASPLNVTAPNGKTNLLVMDATAGLPAAFALLATTAEKKVAIRLAGGCKGMDANDKAAMLEFFEEALYGYRGLCWSGGTRQLNDDGELDPMVTDVPGIIAAANPGCVALGSIPRTDLLTLQGESSLVLDQYGTRPNPSMSGILVVQNGADGQLDWDGDVDVYFRLMEQWRTYAGFTALGVITWNGGAITRDEAIKAAKLGWPTIVISGTGRASDELADQIARNDVTALGLEDLSAFHVVNKLYPDQLRTVLETLGFLDIDPRSV